MVTDFSGQLVRTWVPKQKNVYVVGSRYQAPTGGDLEALMTRVAISRVGGFLKR
jgi:hypothetical protein